MEQLQEALQLANEDICINYGGAVSHHGSSARFAAETAEAQELRTSEYNSILLINNTIDI
jgi:hypothetical protein